MIEQRGIRAVRRGIVGGTYAPHDFSLRCIIIVVIAKLSATCHETARARLVLGKSPAP